MLPSFKASKFRIAYSSNENKMNIDDYVFINKRVLKFVGLYPTNIARYIVCCVCMFTIVIPQAVQIYQNWRDLAVVLETSSVLLTILLAILKSLVWISNRRKMDSFIDYMFTDYWDVMTAHISKHENVYAIYVRKGHLFTKGYLFLICNSLLFFFSLPIFESVVTTIKGTSDNSTNNFPFVALYPESYYNFPMYEIVYFSQMLATSLCGLIILGTDTLIATALFHTCGHFRVLQGKIEHINGEIGHMLQAHNELNIVRKIKLQIISTIKHHYTILCPMLFLQTLASSLIICLVGFQITDAHITANAISKLIKYFSYLLMALFQLLLFCIPGDALIDEVCDSSKAKKLMNKRGKVYKNRYIMYRLFTSQSSTISRTLYTIDWYELPVLFKIEVCLLMLRSQKSSKITAGKFYVMHLENFNAVLSTAVSYFMLLRSFNSD
ncbi:odorant receptor 13a isoform X2 [Ooceraea biroi]|uniref:odorant receptor 13a isoform X2 n=1 Tax=Ooceraea biroi TaxID=2015173 RepID=UPI0009716D40|nr:odorant receptor 13a isoform X2 [Ooceraea biroi]